MSMSQLQRFALCGLFFLGACAFSPLYGSHETEGAPVAQALSSVEISSIPNESGQKLRNLLMDRMYYQGRPAKPTARLSVSISSSETGMGISKDATATLSELSFQAGYVLTDVRGKKLVSGNAKSQVLYSKLDAQYGTLAAQRNAYDRAIHEVSEQIVTRLSLYYAHTQPAQQQEGTEPFSVAAPPEKAAAPRSDPNTSWALGVPVRR